MTSVPLIIVPAGENIYRAGHAYGRWYTAHWEVAKAHAARYGGEVSTYAVLRPIPIPNLTWDAFARLTTALVGDAGDSLDRIDTLALVCAHGLNGWRLEGGYMGHAEIALCTPRRWLRRLPNR